MGAFSACQLTIIGDAFMVAAGFEAPGAAVEAGYGGSDTKLLARQHETLPLCARAKVFVCRGVFVSIDSQTLGRKYRGLERCRDLQGLEVEAFDDESQWMGTLPRSRRGALILMGHSMSL
jgi:hypothetical protein